VRYENITPKTYHPLIRVNLFDIAVEEGHDEVLAV
jgi:hypothetical protein